MQVLRRPSELAAVIGEVKLPPGSRHCYAIKWNRPKTSCPVRRQIRTYRLVRAIHRFLRISRNRSSYEGVDGTLSMRNHKPQYGVKPRHCGGPDTIQPSARLLRAI